MAVIDNIVSYWKLDEASGTREDAHAANDLTSINTVGSATGKISNGADFERTEGNEVLRISDGSQAGLDLAGSFTLAAWVKVETAPSGGAKYTILGKYEGGVSEAYQLNYRDNPALQIELQVAGTGGTTFTWATDLGTGTFHHIVAVFSIVTGDAECYLNGASLGVVAGSVTAITNSTADFTIGNDGAGSGSEFDGVIDEVGVWARAFTPTDVSQLYRGGSGDTYPFTTFITSADTSGTPTETVSTSYGLIVSDTAGSPLDSARARYGFANPNKSAAPVWINPDKS